MMNLFLTCVRIGKKRVISGKLKTPVKKDSIYLLCIIYINSASLPADTYIASYPPDFH